MNIIEDMRREVHLAPTSSIEYLEQCITRWADALEASNALVTVPDGDKCWLEDCGSEAVIWRDLVTQIEVLAIRTKAGCFMTNGDKLDLGYSAIVQPVRLVRLDEYDPEGNSE